MFVPGAVAPPPKLRFDAEALKLNDDGTEPNEAFGAIELAAEAAGAPKAKPAVDEFDAPINCVEFADAEPKENAGVLPVVPKDENVGADVDGAPKPPVEPNVGAVFVDVPLPDEITGGANGRGGLLAPKANVVFDDAVVVVAAPDG